MELNQGIPKPLGWVLIASQTLLQLSCESDWLVPTEPQGRLVASYRAVTLIDSFTASLLWHSFACDFLLLAVQPLRVKNERAMICNSKFYFLCVLLTKKGRRKEGTLPISKGENYTCKSTYWTYKIDVLQTVGFRSNSITYLV